jgi:NADH-quinone oxidoreductase subunit F
MIGKERERWKEKSADQIKDFVTNVYEQEANNPCPVDRLKALSDILRRKSCGECVICREGILQISVLTEAITQGIGRDGDIDVISEISEDMSIGSACDYGREVGKIAKQMLEDEREQFERHIKRKRCDALVCKKFITYYVSPEICSGCNQCLEACEPGATRGGEGLIHIIHSDSCTRCGDCVLACKQGAILKTSASVPNIPKEPVPVGSAQLDSVQGSLMSQKRRRRSE